MPVTDVRIARSIATANTAQQLVDAAMLEFTTYGAAYDWPRAEEARAKVLGHMEAHLDAVTAIYRALESQR